MKNNIFIENDEEFNFNFYEVFNVYVILEIWLCNEFF